MSPIPRRSLTPTRHRHSIQFVCVGAAMLALGAVTVAHAERADFHARSLSGGPVPLLPITTIQVSSEAAADYSARVQISVGGRVIARTTQIGHSDTRWSFLRVPLTAAQRHAIIAAAKHERRRAILDVQLEGLLAGKTQPSARDIPLVMSVPGTRPPAGSVNAGREQITRISLSGRTVNGTGQRLHGRIVIRTPRASFRSTNNDGAPSAHFSAAVTDACQAQVAVTARARATTASALGQARAAFGIADQLLGAGGNRNHVWRLADLSPERGDPTGQKRLYGIAVMRLAPRRWVAVRAISTLGDSCTDLDRRDSDLSTAMKRMLRSASLEARIVAPER
jgi:hypothetical protein